MSTCGRVPRKHGTGPTKRPSPHRVCPKPARQHGTKVSRHKEFMPQHDPKKFTALRAMTARGTMASLRLMLRDAGRHQRNFGPWMPRRFGIIGLGSLRQRCWTTLAGRGPLIHDGVHPIRGKASSSTTRMTELAARLTSGRFFRRTLGRLRRIRGRRTRRVRRVWVEPSLQLPNLPLQQRHPRLKLDDLTLLRGDEGPELSNDLIPLPTIPDIAAPPTPT